MNKTIAISLVLFNLAAGAQISIDSSHLPNENDTLITRTALQLTDFDLEETGPNHVWNFGFDVLEPSAMSPEIPCLTLSTLSLIDQAVFNNPFYPEYNSDYGVGFQQADLTVVSFEDMYQIYKNSGNVFGVTGVIATINGIPLISQMNDPDVIYDLPLTYETSGNSDSELTFEVPTLGYYGLDQTREYICDGWGTLNIWNQSFEVLRVRSVVNATDSVYIEFVQNGLTFDRPEAITYEWIAAEYNVPVLKITTTAGIISQIQTADIYEDANLVNEFGRPVIQVYPNPAHESIKVLGLEECGNYQIHSLTGELVAEGNICNGQKIDLEQITYGLYEITIKSAEVEEHQLFVHH